jgi:translation elongation factor EF-G
MKIIGGKKVIEDRLEKTLKIVEKFGIDKKELENALMSGFELATSSGPLCEEPLLGAIFIVEDIEDISTEPINKNSNI